MSTSKRGVYHLSSTPWFLAAAGTATLERTSFNRPPWKSAPWQAGFSTQHSPGVAPRTQTRFAVLADADYLYIGVERTLPNPKSVDERVQGWGKIGNHSIEMVFAPYLDGAGRIELATGPGGWRIDSATWPYEDNREDITARRCWDSRVWRTRKGYNAIIRIAQSSILPPDLPAPRAVGFNMVCDSGPDGDVSSWIPTCGVNLLSPATVGNLWVDAPEAVFRDLSRHQDGPAWKGVSGTLALSAPLKELRITAQLRDPLGGTRIVETTPANAQGKVGFSLPCGVALKENGYYGIRLSVQANGRTIPTAGGEAGFDWHAAKSGDHPFMLCTTYDIPDDLGRYLYTPQTLKESVSHFHRWGMSRIYWIDYGPLSEGWWSWGFSQADMWGRPNRRYHYTLYSMGACGGDFLPHVVSACHERAMECYAIFKPFDLAICRGSRPMPDSKVKGAPEIIPISEIERVGGSVEGATFIARHPEYCMARNPNWELPPTERPVGTIVLWNWCDAPFAFALKDIVLYVSDDNIAYRPYAGAIRRKEEVVTRPRARWTPAAPVSVAGSDRVRRIVLAGLKIAAPYVIIRCAAADRRGTLRNQLFRLYELFDTRGRPVPHTVGGLFATPGAGAPREAGALLTGGLEFDMGTGAWGQSGPTSCEYLALDQGQGLIGFARRRQLEMRTLHDPSFPEVRRFWLDWIRRELQAGVDGVDIRLTHHNQLLDTACYSFARPIVEAYRRQHGVDILSEPFSWPELRRIRGEFWTEFLRGAKALTRKYGKKLSLHFEPGMDRDARLMGDEQALGWQWDWKTWIEEGLADEIVLKHIYPEHPFVRREILPRCKARGIPVHVSAWFGTPACRTGKDKARMAKLYKTMIERLCRAGIRGYNFYEALSWLGPNANGKLAGCGSAEDIMAACQKILKRK